MTDNKSILEWIDEIKALTTPDHVMWITGDEEQLEQLRVLCCKTGELIKLNQDKLPGCYLHRSNPSDVARVEERTFICTKNEREAGPTNNWMEKDKAYGMLKDIFTGSMKGRTMYIIPFSMGIEGSPFAKYGIEVTDSAYVVLNMAIMTRIGKTALNAIGGSDDWARCLHSIAKLDANLRYICHFPDDNAIWSVNSGYGGNALLGKKCLALRIASARGYKEGWLAEHMLIIGIENPSGKTIYMAAAFPSACGKTNLAMLQLPQYFLDKGYKVRTIGDDIAWLRIGKDGRLWAVNPENGLFGVAPGTSEKSNLNAIFATQKNTIFTNVAQNLDDNTVWWEKKNNDPPKNALNWKGDKWTAEDDTPGAHPNSRFTAFARNCPCIGDEFDNPEGVPISAIIFGGRRARLAPLVYGATSWQHGVFIGSGQASETTAAAAGKVGIVRRDPMAMLPFCGYNMGDYFRHWLDMGKKLGDKAPLIFNVNWFRTYDDETFVWPGFGENIRVLKYIIDCVEGTANIRHESIGIMPSAEDIYLNGTDLTKADMNFLLNVDADLWLEELKDIEKFYQQFEDAMPQELYEELESLRERLMAQKSGANDN